ncbi:nucleotide exchange factor GrpE [Lyngbya aestuarii]|uniref:nucleotide exchange factor GrpE n=1 Tax=Lyngbya aestuarii TaxID=118322 RepID=UPI00403E2B23
MIDEEKQLDNNSPQADEPIAASQSNEAEGSVATEEQLSRETDVESQSPDDQTSETSAVKDEGENQEVVEGTSATEGLPTDSESGGSEILKQEIEALKAQLEEQTRQSEALKTQSVRIAADFENFRKRTGKEKEELEIQVKRQTISKLLPIVDNFERARSHIKPQSEGEMIIHKSYQSVYKQLVDSLKGIGVSPMRSEGQEFDPNLHEAVMREPTDEYPEGVVTEQLQRGYFMGDRVLRHAMVKVAAAMEPVLTSEESTPESTEN